LQDGANLFISVFPEKPKSLKSSASTNSAILSVLEEIHGTTLVRETHDDEPHGNPHRQSTSSPFTKEKGKDATSKTTQVVYTDNDTLQPSVGVAELIAKVLITDDTAKDSLVVSGYEQTDHHPD
jgi:hypothetical protein